MPFPHWAICDPCNGQGCRHCNYKGEIVVIIR